MIINPDGCSCDQQWTLIALELCLLCFEGKETTSEGGDASGGKSGRLRWLRAFRRSILDCSNSEFWPGDEQRSVDFAVVSEIIVTRLRGKDSRKVEGYKTTV